jgi:staphyloferrin B biosynthesis citrate synthase
MVDEGAAEFRQRFRQGAPLLGSFVKTPTSHAVEILGDVGFDFVVIDEEHAPFDRAATDVALLAARAADIAGVVRVADGRASNLLSVLDGGASGVLVPHVSTAAKAREVAAACRYRGGKRGFSNSPRAGGYGRLGIWDHVEGDAATTVIAMIEDPEALDEIDAIAAVEGIDGLFIGRGDLTVALGAPAMDSEPVRQAVEAIAAAGRAGGKTLCAMAGRAAEAEWLRALGITAFIISSDQGFLRQAAGRALVEFAPPQS